MLDEEVITKAIVEEYMRTFLENTDVEAALGGAGPANLVAAKKLAEKGVKTAVYEEKLNVGGGMWGGGMMYPRIVVQEEAKRILKEFGINFSEYEKGYYVASSIESVARLASEAVKAGAEIFNLTKVEDVMVREDDHIAGVVLNWSAVEKANLHVDPLTVKADVVIDGTGHDAEICRVTQRKIPDADLQVRGEKPMWAEKGEKALMDTTKEVYPGLIVSGMAANAVSAGPRMGPVFGGMLLSGEKAAELALERIEEK
ncbi:ribulose-1,5-biphosphate synthetase [candidate division MSBL1 archaeon SCGC-AAA259E19]|uniref:Thiamine thiazole synthase n=2 Tax=candidate division MSBL1 TaxID=215777 RepID=A0A133V508_9EURY|nr:ribulose-1,5-biphosphate synthetase [candidate division MSBL1 archaeon SCGC-AAA259E19]KXB01532.1 ribulose-1,5-biphosphate synthetase [candidate division MSBL1 archaeon SCGC-AAA259O05]